MPRLIDADALREAVKQKGTASELIWCVAEIDRAPTIEAEPVRHGTWEDVNSAYWRWYPEGARVVNRVTYRCSRCGRGAITKTDYCTCGAKMDGVVSDEG